MGLPMAGARVIIKYRKLPDL